MHILHIAAQAQELMHRSPVFPVDFLKRHQPDFANCLFTPHLRIGARTQVASGRVYFKTKLYGVQRWPQKFVYAQEAPHPYLQAGFFPKLPLQCPGHRFAKLQPSAGWCPEFTLGTQSPVPDQKYLIVNQTKATDPETKLMTEGIQNFFVNFVHGKPANPSLK